MKEFVALFVGTQSLPACLPQSLHHTGSQPWEEIPQAPECGHLGALGAVPRDEGGGRSF